MQEWTLEGIPVPSASEGLDKYWTPWYLSGGLPSIAALVLLK